MIGGLFFFSSFLLFVGLAIGSFLNVCIYRVPRRISLWRPARSFCLSCNKTIPWYENLPVLSYWLLRGRCSGCGARIPFRYWIVEVISGVLFLLIWNRFDWPLAGCYCVLVMLLIVGSFIDLEHYIIPDEITCGGIVAGIILSGVVPMMMHSLDRWDALLRSSIGSAAGLISLLGVVEIGKFLFGRKHVVLAKVENFVIMFIDGRLVFKIGETSQYLDEILVRRSDALVIKCEEVTFGTEKFLGEELRVKLDSIKVQHQELAINQQEELRGKAIALTLPREAMGLGDVKFLGAIGAFVGWQGVLFTICASSILGSIVGIGMLIKNRNDREVILPFGPFLAIGALLWLFFK